MILILNNGRSSTASRRPSCCAGGADEATVHAVCSHGWGLCSDVEPTHEMEKLLFASDEADRTDRRGRAHAALKSVRTWAEKPEEKNIRIKNSLPAVRAR